METNTPELVKYSPDEVKAAMIAAEIVEVLHHPCGLCGTWVRYLREGEQLYFDSSCDCCGVGAPQPRDWSDASEWINMQSKPEIQRKVAGRFGLNPES